MNAVTCRNFAKRAEVINDEAKRTSYASDRRRLQDCVMSMHEVWKEAKAQGDPSDPEIIKKRLRENRRVLITKGYDW